MCISSALIRFSPFISGEQIRTILASCMKAVNIGMYPLRKGAAHGNHAAAVILGMSDDNGSRTIIKISYRQIQGFGKTAACPTEETEKDGSTSFLKEFGVFG